jgi:hypothetical protein
MRITFKPSSVVRTVNRTCSRSAGENPLIFSYGDLTSLSGIEGNIWAENGETSVSSTFGWRNYCRNLTQMDEMPRGSGLSKAFRRNERLKSLLGSAGGNGRADGQVL